jgi:hypothetical protein
MREELVTLLQRVLLLFYGSDFHSGLYNDNLQMLQVTDGAVGLV